MSDPRMIPADEAKALLEATGLRECEVEHFASYDPEEKYPFGARSLVYIDGYEDVDGLGVFQQTGGSICDGVPEEVAPLFAAAPDLAYTVERQAAQIARLQKAVTESEIIFWEATGHDLEQQLERKGVTLDRDDLEDTNEH